MSKRYFFRTIRPSATSEISNHLPKAPILISTFCILLTFTYFFLMCFTFSARAESSIRTPHGVISIKELRGASCGDYLDKCKAITYNGRTIAKDYIAYINSSYSIDGNVVLISATTSTGGNACCFEDYFIDLSKSTPKTFKDTTIIGSFFTTSRGAGFFVSAPENQYGDRQQRFVDYSLSTQEKQYGPIIPLNSTVPLALKSTPEDFLSDVKARENLLALMKIADFRALRQALVVGASVRRINDRYYVLEGCMPHACNSITGLAIYDSVTNIWWTALSDATPQTISAKVWGDLNNPVVKSELGKWLADLKIHTSFVNNIKPPKTLDDVYLSSRASQASTTNPYLPTIL